MATFVLVPGAGGEPWFWGRLVEQLRLRGHRGVPVDLPGHDPSVDLEGYVDRIVEAIEAVEGEVVLVAQSFGGFSASAAALRVPVSHLVLVNAMIPAPGESAGEWWGAVGVAEERRTAEAAAGRDPQAEFDVLEVFFHDASPDVLAEAPEHEREQTDLAFGSPWPGAAWPDVPTSVLVGDDDRLFPPGLQARIAHERLGLPVTLVPGGHLGPLTRAEAFADVLLTIAG